MISAHEGGHSEAKQSSCAGKKNFTVSLKEKRYDSTLDFQIRVTEEADMFLNPSSKC